MWWMQECHAWCAKQMPRVHAALIRAALGDKTESSAPHCKLALERWDEGYQPKTRREVSGRMTLGLVEDQEELRRLAHATDDDAAAFEEEQRE